MDLRKIAVVVASLDADTADCLLEQMSEEQSQRVRHAVMSLTDITDDEARVAISTFLDHQARGGGPESSLRQVRNVPDVDAHRAARDVVNAERISQADAEHLSPIQRASERVIADCLQGELPQAIAVALTDLPARRASEVVSYLPATLQAEVLERMVELTPDMQPDSSEIRDEFRGWLNEQIERSLHRADLANRLATILNATHRRAREQIMHNVASSDAKLAKELELQLSHGDG